MDLEFSILLARLQECMAADNVSDADVQGWTLSDMTMVCMCYALTTLPCASSGNCLPGRPGICSLEGIATGCQLCCSISHVWASAAFAAASPAAQQACVSGKASSTIDTNEDQPVLALHPAPCVMLYRQATH